MKNKRCSFFFSILIALIMHITNSTCFGMEKSTPLDWENRPKQVKEEAMNQYLALSHQNRSSWGKFNGEERYDLLNLNEHMLLKQMIKEAYPNQKEFYVMDIGAGNFGWLHSVAKMINEAKDLPNDFVLHIIGIRGEDYEGFKQLEKGRCILYQLGGFAIENMESQFKHLKYDFANKIDMIISRWTFVHFVDSLGTFVQAYNFLRPKTGVLIMDGFRLLFEDTKLGDFQHQVGYDYTSKSTYNFDQQMLYFLSHIKAPLLIKDSGETNAHFQFMIQRPDDKKLEIPVTYMGLMKVAERSEDFKQGAPDITQYRRHEPWKTGDISYKFPSPRNLSGDFHLYQWIADMKDIHLSPDHDWQPFITSHPLSEKEEEYLKSMEKKKEEAEKKYKEQREINDKKPFNIIKKALSNENIEEFKQALSSNNNWQNLALNQKYVILNKTIDIYDTMPQFFVTLLEVGIELEVLNLKRSDTLIINIINLFDKKILTFEQATYLISKLISLGADLNLVTDDGETALSEADELKDKSLYEFLKKFQK